MSGGPHLKQWGSQEFCVSVFENSLLYRVCLEMS